VLVVTQGDALRACPGLLYIAPLALSFQLLRVQGVPTQRDNTPICSAYFAWTGGGPGGQLARSAPNGGMVPSAAIRKTEVQ